MTVKNMNAINLLLGSHEGSNLPIMVLTALDDWRVFFFEPLVEETFKLLILQPAPTGRVDYSHGSALQHWL